LQVWQSSWCYLYSYNVYMTKEVAVPGIHSFCMRADLHATAVTMLGQCGCCCAADAMHTPQKKRLEGLEAMYDSKLEEIVHLEEEAKQTSAHLKTSAQDC
jgi:hypothetical protein